MYGFEQLDELECSPDFRAYHLLLTDHVMLTLVVDAESGRSLGARTDLVEDGEPETGYEIAAHSIQLLVGEPTDEVFSSEGIDVREGIDATVAAIVQMAAERDEAGRHDPLPTHTGGPEMRPHFCL